MSKSGVNRTGRSTKASRHVRLYHWMMDKPAWKSLNGNQRAIYVEMAKRYAGPGSNNGRIPYSVREAAESLRISRSTAARDLKVLQDRGFIVMTKRGAFNVKTRRASEWRLTEFSCDLTDAIATKEFARWSSEIQNTVPVAGPNGTCSGTMTLKNSPDGIPSGTVKPFSADSRSHHRDTSSVPGGSRTAVSAASKRWV